MILFVDDAFVPPVFAVYQPSNLYPFLVRLSNVPYSLPVISVLAAGVEGPPFASNFKVYSFDQDAVTVWSPLQRVTDVTAFLLELTTKEPKKIAQKKMRKRTPKRTFPRKRNLPKRKKTQRKSLKRQQMYPRQQQRQRKKQQQRLQRRRQKP